MKKFLKFLIVQFSAIFILMGAFFGLQNLNKSTLSTEAATPDIRVVRIKMSNMFMVDTLEFSYKGATVQYSASGFEFGGDNYEGKVILQLGETIDLVNGCSRKETVSGYNYYYLTKEELSTGFKQVAGTINFPIDIPVDFNTPVNFSVVVTEESQNHGDDFSNWFFYTISYSETGTNAQNHNLFRFQTDLDGNIGIDGTLENGMYVATANSRSFKANFDNENGGKLLFVVDNADNITINLNSANKSFPVEFNGNRVVDSGDDFKQNDNDFISNRIVDGVKVTLPVNIADVNTYDFIFAPESGRLIKRLSLQIGSTEEVFTIYGGKYEEYKTWDGQQLVTQGELYWPAGVPDGGQQGLHSDYAYSLFCNGNYKYTFCQPDQENPEPRYILDVEADPANPIKNRYTITLCDNGAIRVSTSSAIKGASFELESLSYVQVNVKLVQNFGGVEDVESHNSIALKSLMINGEEATTPSGEIPRMIVKFDADQAIEVKATLKDKFYNFTDAMPGHLIDGKVFTYTINSNGEVLDIYTKEASSYNLTIILKDESGNVFKDAHTEIYIRTALGDIDSKQDLMFNSNLGEVTKSGIYYEDTVKIKIKFSPYVMLVVDKVDYVLEYNAEVTGINNNTILEILVKYIEMERPVFFNEEEIGKVKLRLTAFTSTESGLTITNNAIYEVLFKAEGETDYTTVTSQNPYRRGYDFKNLVIDGKNILTEYVSGKLNTFGVSGTDTTKHVLIAEKVYFADGTGENKITAVFTPQLISFMFNYGGETYNAKSYFDSCELYINKAVEISEPGKYFAGIQYTFDSGEMDYVEIAQANEPVLMEEGEFVGFYKYILNGDRPWGCEDPNAYFEVRTAFKALEYTIIYTKEGNGSDAIKGTITFGDPITIETITEEKHDGIGPVYPKSGPSNYNHIGWMVVDASVSDKYYTSESGECDILVNQTVNYEWDYNSRIVPVFSANIIIVNVYNEGEQFIEPVKVKSAETVDFAKFFFDGEDWACPNKFGYNLVGLSLEGSEQLVARFSWVDRQPNFEPVLDGNSEGDDAIFFVDGGVVKWTASKNLDLVATYEIIDYELIIDIEGSEYARTENFSADIAGSWTPLIDNKMSFTGFGVDATMTLTGFAPKTSDSYIRLVRLGYGARGEVKYLEREYYALCDEKGVVTGEVVGTRFDPEYNRLIISIPDFINDSTRLEMQSLLRTKNILGDTEELDEKEMKIYLDLDYAPVTYLISFTGRFDYPFGDNEISDVADPVYYKVTKETATISKVDEWIQCDASGFDTGKKGWKNICTPEYQIEFGKNSLEGISGIFYKDGSLTFSFKFWKDYDNNLQLDDASVLTGNYNFVSVFSDNFDVTVNYYIFNDATEIYIKDSIEGYFWEYDQSREEFTICEVRTANAYEIYLIDGELYYISHWSREASYTVKFAVGPEDLALSQVYDIEYSENSMVIDFYAVYTKFDYSVTKTATGYKANVYIPNDPAGNSYTAEDISYIKIDAGLYDSVSGGSALKTIDILNTLLTTQALIDEAELPSNKGVLDDSVIEPQYYVFAVLQRKVDGYVIPAFYMAVNVTV